MLGDSEMAVSMSGIIALYHHWWHDAINICMGAYMYIISYAFRKLE